MWFEFSFIPKLQDAIYFYTYIQNMISISSPPKFPFFKWLYPGSHLWKQLWGRWHSIAEILLNHFISLEIKLKSVGNIMEVNWHLYCKAIFLHITYISVLWHSLILPTPPVLTVIFCHWWRHMYVRILVVFTYVILTILLIYLLFNRHIASIIIYI